MFLSSVNLGTAQRVGNHYSGIFKTGVSTPVRLSKEGLIGDTVCDKRYHGGADQAVYVYGGDDYAWWTANHARGFEPGLFGDNLTIDGLSSTDVYVGDRFELGEVELEATAPRIPCANLGHRMSDSRFPGAFRKAARPGFYCRVLVAGEVKAGVPVEHRRIDRDDPDALSIVGFFHFYYKPSPTAEEIERVLRAPIAVRNRRAYETQLAAL